MEASTNSPAEERLPEMAEREMEKIGLICSEKSREEAVDKTSLIHNQLDISFDSQYTDQDCIQEPEVQSSKIWFNGTNQ